MKKFMVKILNKRLFFNKNLGSSQRYTAFTLSEVLITLMIIGTVAAITIPQLMNEIQDRQFKEAAKEAYSKASQAIQQMKQDNGGSLSAYYITDANSANSFKSVFMTYFKIIKDCGNSSCVAYNYSSTVYKTLHLDPADTDRMDDGQFITNDGMFWGIENDVSNDYGFIYITVDVNGYTRDPNVFGRDTFTFQLINDNLVPMGGNNTAFPTSSNYCNKAVSNTHQGIGCMCYVMQGVDY